MIFGHVQDVDKESLHGNQEENVCTEIYLRDGLSQMSLTKVPCQTTLNSK